MEPDTSFVGALRNIVTNIDHSLFTGITVVTPVKMCICGAVAMHFYTGGRFTSTLRAAFSHRLILPISQTASKYKPMHGPEEILYLDQAYNHLSDLIHPDYMKSASVWDDLLPDPKILEIHVLSPLDLAVSYLKSFTTSDQQDLSVLVSCDLIRLDDLRTRTYETLSYFVGDKQSVLTNLQLALSGNMAT